MQVWLLGANKPRDEGQVAGPTDARTWCGSTVPVLEYYVRIPSQLVALKDYGLIPDRLWL